MPDSKEPNKDEWTPSDIGHLALDVVGFIPLVGEAADLTNAAWYAAEGNYLDAGLSLISMIPIVGDVIGKGGKAAKKLSPKALNKILDSVKQLDIPKYLKNFKSSPKIAPHIEEISNALTKWQDKLALNYELLKANLKLTTNGVAKCPDLNTSNGVRLVADLDKTTTVLGTYIKDTKYREPIEKLEKEAEILGKAKADKHEARLSTVRKFKLEDVKGWKK